MSILHLIVSYIAYLRAIQCGNLSHLQKLKGLCDDIAMALLFYGQVILLTTDIILILCITMLKMHIIIINHHSSFQRLPI